MASFRLSEKAELELDDAWLFTARESGSVEIGTRVVESIYRRLDFLLRILTPAAAAITIYAQADERFAAENT